MKIKTKKIDQTSVVSIEGDIDALTSGQVTEFLDDCIKQGETKLVIDLSRVDFMSSAGLRVVLGAVKKSRTKSGDIHLAAPQPGVARVLKMAGFENVLNLFESIDQAVIQFREHS